MMTDREKEINRLTELAISKAKEVNKLSERIDLLTNQKDFHHSDFVKPNTKDEKFFTYQIEKGSYENILGGDGRSRPWSEQKEGTICKVSLSPEYYFDQVHRQIIKTYIGISEEFDHIQILEDV